MSFQPAIKWSGSKRSQAYKIVDLFPDQINTYYEPFVGGGSVLFALMTSGKAVNRYVCSDYNKDLIELWIAIKNTPEAILSDYRRMWNELDSIVDGNERKEYYYRVRERYNRDRQPSDFVFVNRTCANGLIRYNRQGNFNTSFHFSRKGIEPDNLDKIIREWSELLNKNNVEFIHCSYQDIHTELGDVLYCDPPYAETKGMYYGSLDYEEYFTWYVSQKAFKALSFDGKRGEKDFTYEVPKEAYDKHLYLSSGISSMTRLKQKGNVEVFESLYYKEGVSIE